jgi:hypothetical protein
MCTFRYECLSLPLSPAFDVTVGPDISIVCGISDPYLICRCQMIHFSSTGSDDQARGYQGAGFPSCASPAFSLTSRSFSLPRNVDSNRQFLFASAPKNACSKLFGHRVSIDPVTQGDVELYEFYGCYRVALFSSYPITYFRAQRCEASCFTSSRHERCVVLSSSVES